MAQPTELTVSLSLSSSTSLDASALSAILFHKAYKIKPTEKACLAIESPPESDTNESVACKATEV